MNELESLRRIVKSNKKMSLVFEKLRLWEDTNTIEDNAHICGLTIGSSRIFARRYNLNFKRKRLSGPIGANMLKRIAYKKLFDSGLTYQQIGDIFGVTRQSIEESIRHLSYSCNVLNH